MERVCLKCGELSQDVAKCTKCAAPMDSPIEKDNKVVVSPTGVKLQSIAVVSYIIAWFNLLFGPVAAFVTLFNPIIPAWVYSKIPYSFFFYSTLIMPVLATLCLVLNSIAKRMYKPTKHAPKNHLITWFSYRLNVWAVLLWMLFVVIGLSILFYLIKFGT